MLPFKKILCPIDFSGPSIEGLKTAGELALHFSSELLVVFVIPPIAVHLPPETMPLPAFDVARYRQNLREYYGGLVPEVIDKNVSKNVVARPLILEGDVAREIAEASRENGVDLIVVVPHSHSDLRRIFFGSLAQKIARLAPCPVITLPSRPVSSPAGVRIPKAPITNPRTHP